MTTLSQAAILIEATGDHLESFRRTVTEPTLTIAPWVSVRSALESSALACWLMNPEIPIKERVGRSLALRYEGKQQEVKYLRSIDKEDAIEKAKDRAKKIVESGKALGFSELKFRTGNKAGQTRGVACSMPSFSELIKNELGKESEYRLFSAMVHGHQWALLQLGFQRSGGIQSRQGTSQWQPEKFAESRKGLQPISLFYLSYAAAEALNMVIRTRTRLYGGAVTQLENVWLGFNSEMKAVYASMRKRRESSEAEDHASQ